MRNVPSKKPDTIARSERVIAHVFTIEVGRENVAEPVDLQLPDSASTVRAQVFRCPLRCEAPTATMATLARQL